MGRITDGMASSHAYALVEPAGWDHRRLRSRGRYAARYGVEPRAHPNVAAKVSEERERRYRPIREALEFFRRRMDETRPDALIVVGDDQDENFTDDNLPQIAVYTGAQLHAVERAGDGSRVLGGPRYACHPELARDLLNGLVEREFDVAECRSFANDELLSHAHAPILRRVLRMPTSRSSRSSSTPSIGRPRVPVAATAWARPCARSSKAAREASASPSMPPAASPTSPRTTRGNTTLDPAPWVPSVKISTAGRRRSCATGRAPDSDA